MQETCKKHIFQYSFILNTMPQRPCYNSFTMLTNRNTNSMQKTCAVCGRMPIPILRFISNMIPKRLCCNSFTMLTNHTC